MPEFSYEAVAGTGEHALGVLTANNEREAMSLLDAKGLFPIRIQPAQAAARFRLFGRRVRGRAMATFYTQLADLLRAGVPLLRSLDILERMGGQPTLQQAIREIRGKVAEGTSLAQAMSQYPNVFDELAVSMVRAGQEGGFLEDVLVRISEFTEHQEDLKSKVVGAMAYPIFLAIAGVIVLFGLVLFVIPNFEPIFAKLREKNQMPTVTKLVLGFSHFMIGNWWWVFPLLFAMGIGFWYWKRTPAGRYRVDKIKLKVPGMGRIFLNLSLSRFTRILGTMLHNGIPILRALEISKDSTGNRVLADAIHESAEHITAGQKLATPLGKSPYFPHDVVEMISIAEESNNLETVLVKIADSLDKRTTRQLELFVRLLEPIMLVVMAVGVGTIAAGLLLPIFKMGSAIR